MQVNRFNITSTEKSFGQPFLPKPSRFSPVETMQNFHGSRYDHSTKASTDVRLKFSFPNHPLPEKSPVGSSTHKSSLESCFSIPLDPLKSTVSIKNTPTRRFDHTSPKVSTT